MALPSIHTLYEQAVLLVIMHLENLFHHMGPRMFTAALLIKTKAANSPNTHGHENGLKYIYSLFRNRLVVAKGEVGGGGRDWEFGVSRCKLLHIGWIKNKALHYSTGNNIQYPGINHNGKEYKKECIYVHN